MTLAAEANGALSQSTKRCYIGYRTHLATTEGETELTRMPHGPR